VSVFSEEELAASVGRRFPGGSYTIEPWRAWLTNDVVLAPQGGTIAHPVFAFIAATQAMGIGWDELFAWFGASAGDGPMMGDCDIEFGTPLLVGATYRVDGAICSAVRKSGRRAGVFDLVHYRLDLREPGGGLAAACVNSIVFPRRGG
jgi:hypothetical protein